MEQYISKSALVAEIENRIKKYTLLQQTPEMSDLQEELQNKINCLNSIKGYILNTLEVKEVDLEKEYKDFVEEDPVYNKLVNGIVGKAIAKHFFEIGIKTQKGEKV